MRPATGDGGSSTINRRASEVVLPALRGIVVTEQRRMPRLPSMRKL